MRVAAFAASLALAGCSALPTFAPPESARGVGMPSAGLKALLPAMRRSLAKKGWHIAQTPLYGIGQGWGGSYEHRYYQPGLLRWEIVAQAEAFCEFGATYVGWYAWDDSGFESRTNTPNNSDFIADGMAGGIGACRQVWK